MHMYEFSTVLLVTFDLRNAPVNHKQRTVEHRTVSLVCCLSTEIKKCSGSFMAAIACSNMASNHPQTA